ncbi:MAG: UDP-3-O-(3-hydroxymyristoyl)glucosamine N-acyltransferase [Gammaproteobacteria bacterium]|nr:UDP-3-O-(3-hydroxymyristoyl)glucosamine N-acyltransferase [Gammaproteobacteria bacterium]
MKKKLKELAQLINAEIKGDENCEITGIGTLENAKLGDISFLTNIKYKNHLIHTKASAVILEKQAVEFCPTHALIVQNPHLAYAKIAENFIQHPKVTPGIHATAIIGKNCHIDPSVTIGAYVVIGDDVIIGAHTQIDTGCIIGNHCQMGQECHLWAHVTLYYDVKIQDRVIIHSGTVIGGEGLGFANDQGIWYKVPQIGSVLIESDVEIGANNVIDRGAVEDTLIERGVKMGNANVIGHNDHIGAHTIMVGQVGIAGSTKIGKHCMIGGGAGFAGHIEIADGCIFTAKANVPNSIKEKGMYSAGVGIMPTQIWRKNVARFRHLDELAKRVKKLEEKS